MQLHIRKARVIDPQSKYHDKVVDLLIEDGVITAIGGSVKPNAGAKKIEAKGLKTNIPHSETQPTRKFCWNHYYLLV